MRGAKPLLPRLAETGFDAARLPGPEQALIAFFTRARLAAPQIERVGLSGALHRVLAEPIAADADYPAGARSTMDGFAVDSRATPGRLALAGEVRMGSAPSEALVPGGAWRIPTGGMIPAGADAVVPIEDARIDGASVVVEGAVDAGDCVTPRGSDMRAGEPAIEYGRTIGAAELGVLATLGIVDVPVFRRPLFGVVSSGDELVDAAKATALGQIRDSNSWAIGAALEGLGARARLYPIVRDDEAAMEGALRGALCDCDGLVLTGGSSVGERDLTPQVLERLGAPGVIVHGIRVKPGKPTVLAAVGGKPAIGLPGNPASALLILEAVVAPIVAALLGALVPAPVFEATLGADIEKRAGWTWIVPVEREAGSIPVVHPLPMRSSHVSLLARAHGYLLLGEEIAKVGAGERVSVVAFRTARR